MNRSMFLITPLTQTGDLITMATKITKLKGFLEGVFQVKKKTSWGKAWRYERKKSIWRTIKYTDILFSDGSTSTGFYKVICPFRSDQISHSVVSDSFRPHESQHARPTCPSPTPGVHSDSCPSSQWCHPAISSSVVPFSSCPQSLPASESFPMSQLFARVAKVLEFQL